jgi:copper chaperone CopZ
MSIHTMNTVQPIEKPVDRASLMTAMTAFLEVRNMRCSHCATWVRNGLLKLDGVLVVDVFFKHGIAAATYDPSLLTTDDLLGAIADAGQDICHYYDAELIGQEIAVRALHLER